ncbi:hypothetical protein [Enterococcus gilvus]|uniref:hypothetical protein n=1 Tax=Enterococcus gilvus TaxID=160453 RepID=UPI003ED948AA
MMYQVEYDYELLLDEPITLSTTKEEVSMLSFYVRFGTLFSSKEEAIKKVIINGQHVLLSDLLTVSYSKETKKITYQLNENYTEGYEIASYYVGVGRLSVSPRKSTKDEFFWIIENYGEKIMTDSKLQTNLYKIFEYDNEQRTNKLKEFITEDAFIFSDYELFDKERNIFRYKKDQMAVLCSEELGEAYVTPFQNSIQIQVILNISILQFLRTIAQYKRVASY